MQDLIIKNAMLYDGTGAAPRLEQVAVKDGMIAAVGADCGPAREVIDADGLALMPGIIDSHTHYDAQITWDPLLAVAVAGRHHRGHGQLRFHNRALPTRRS